MVFLCPCPLDRTVCPPNRPAASRFPVPLAAVSLSRSLRFPRLSRGRTPFSPRRRRSRLRCLLLLRPLMRLPQHSRLPLLLPPLPRVSLLLLPRLSLLLRLEVLPLLLLLRLQTS